MTDLIPDFQVLLIDFDLSARRLSTCPGPSILRFDHHHQLQRQDHLGTISRGTSGASGAQNQNFFFESWWGQWECGGWNRTFFGNIYLVQDKFVANMNMNVLCVVVDWRLITNIHEKRDRRMKSSMVKTDVREGRDLGSDRWFSKWFVFEDPATWTCKEGRKGHMQNLYSRLYRQRRQVRFACFGCSHILTNLKVVSVHLKTQKERPMTPVGILWDLRVYASKLERKSISSSV